MSDGIVFVGGGLVYFPEFDTNDFDYDARAMYRSIERAMTEGE